MKIGGYFLLFLLIALVFDAITGFSSTIASTGTGCSSPCWTLIQRNTMTFQFSYGDLTHTITQNFSPAYSSIPNATYGLVNSVPLITTFPVNGTMYSSEPVQSGAVLFDTSSVTGDSASCAGACVQSTTIAAAPSASGEFGIVFLYVSTSTNAGNPGTFNSISDNNGNNWILVKTIFDNQGFGSSVSGFVARISGSVADTVTVKWNVPAATTDNIGLTFGLYKNAGGIGNTVTGLGGTSSVSLNIGRANSWAVGGDLSVLDSCTITAGAGLTQRQNDHANCLLHAVYDFSYDDTNGGQPSGSFIYSDSNTGVANVYLVFELVPQYNSPVWTVSSSSTELFNDPSHEMGIVALEASTGLRWGMACLASSSFVPSLTITLQLSVDRGVTWSNQASITGNSSSICSTKLISSPLFTMGSGTGGSTNNPGILRIIGSCSGTCSTNLAMSEIYAPQNTIVWGGVTILLTAISKTQISIAIQLPSNALSSFQLQIFWMAGIIQ